MRDSLLPGRDGPSSTHSEAGCLVLQVRDMWTWAPMSGTESLESGRARRTPFEIRGLIPRPAVLLSQFSSIVVFFLL
jgi:hypothetical protein